MVDGIQHMTQKARIRIRCRGPLAACFMFASCLTFSPDDGDDMFLQNFDWPSPDRAGLHRIENSSRVKTDLFFTKVRWWYGVHSKATAPFAYSKRFWQHEPSLLGLKGVLVYIFILIYHGRTGTGPRFGLIGNNYQTALLTAPNAPKHHRHLCFHSVTHRNPQAHCYVTSAVNLPPAIQHSIFFFPPVPYET
jgi:hypothetical protein